MFKWCSRLRRGKIWLDRVELHDRWLDDFENKALKQMLNLAGYKLHEQGDLVGCLKILDSYWPRFIDQYYAGRVETADADGSKNEGVNPRR